MSAAPDPSPTPPSGGAGSMSLGAQLGSFNKVFWIANGIEMIERLAYYGLRAVVALYIVAALEEGGPQFTHVEKGSIFAMWAAVQSFIPIFTGGYADRYGYKLTVAISVAIKIVGYLVMGFAIELGAATSGGASVGVANDPTVFWWFFLGAGLLAFGTAVFKPGIQGIIALQLKESNASVGWSVFYQLVNLGGFLGPFLAGAMRVMAWRYVFISCAVIVAINWLVLLTFPEPEREAMSAASTSRQGGGIRGFFQTLWDSFIGIWEPRLAAFLVVFSGFWAMFHQLFDLLPNYIEDWVDTSMVAAALAPIVGVPEAWHGQLPPEYMINLNAGMCMTLAFLIGYLTGKVRSMTAMIAGILVAGLAIFSLAASTNGWFILLGIASFSVGELMSSPTKMRYFTGIAPPGKKGLYLGYINATGGIGWALGSIIAGSMYEEGGDKVVLARRHLIEELGQDPTVVDAIAKTEVMPQLATQLGTSVEAAQQLLFTTYNPTFVWVHFAIIGFLSMAGLLVFDQITRRNLPAEPQLLLVLTVLVAWYTYGWFWAAVFGAFMALYMVLQVAAPEALPQGRD